MSTQVADLYAKLGVKPDASAWEKAQGLVKGLTLGLAALGTYAVVKTGRALVGLGEDAMNAADKITDLKKRTGVSAEFLQAFALAAGDPVGKLDAVGDATAKLGLALEDAIINKKDPLRGALAELGISMNDPAIKARDLELLTLKISKGFMLMENGSQKFGIATRLYGKNAKEMVKPLNDLAEKLAFMRDQGGALSEDQVTDLSKAKGKLEDLSNAWSLIKLKAGAALGPPLLDMISKVFKWFDQNKAAIQAWLSSASEIILKIGTLLGTYFAGAIEKAGKFFEALKGGGFISDQMKESFTKIGNVVAALAKALGPVLELIGKIAAVAIALLLPTFNKLLDIVETLLGTIGDIATALLGLPSAIGSAFEDVQEGLAGLPEEVGKAFDNLTEGVSNIPGNVIESVTSSFAAPARKAKPNDAATLNQQKEAVSDWFASTFANNKTIQPKGAPVTNNVQGSTVNVTVNTSASDVTPIITKQMQADADRMLRDAFANLAGATP